MCGYFDYWLPFVNLQSAKSFFNKKVLLPERKRHTAHRVASARFADQSSDVGWGEVPNPVFDGGTPSSLGHGGTLSNLGWGVPHLVLDGGYPVQSWMGVPWVPPLGPGKGYPPPGPGMGVTPINWMWYPPVNWMGTPLPGPGMGYPDQLDGEPHQSAGWSTSPPHLDLGWDTSHELDGVPPTWTQDGVLPHQPDGYPPNGEQTDIPKYKYYLPSYYVCGQ